MGVHIPGEKFVRIQYRRFQNWILPQYALCGMLTIGLLFICVAVIFLAIGRFLTPWGIALFVIGIILMLVLLFFCLHAYCVFELRDQETQTSDAVYMTGKEQPDFIPTYAVVDKKPPIAPDSGIRNGRYGGGTFPKKHVTMAPGSERPANEKSTTIPVQYQAPAPSHVTYGQPRTYNVPPQQGSNVQQGYSPQSYAYPQQVYPPYTQNRPQGGGFPLQNGQPTPYSSLTKRPSGQVGYQQPSPSSRGYTPDTFGEDYDNTHETVPMIGQSQRQPDHSWRSNESSRDDDVPAPQPLVYPSERRPMTFEQTSSSKMSIYDNMYALDKLDEE